MLFRVCSGPLRPISISVVLAARAKRTALEHAQLELLRNIFSSLLYARIVLKVECVSTFSAKWSEATDMEIGLYFILRWPPLHVFLSGCREYIQTWRDACKSRIYAESSFLTVIKKTHNGLFWIVKLFAPIVYPL